MLDLLIKIVETAGALRSAGDGASTLGRLRLLRQRQIIDETLAQLTALVDTHGFEDEDAADIDRSLNLMGLAVNAGDWSVFDAQAAQVGLLLTRPRRKATGPAPEAEVEANEESGAPHERAWGWAQLLKEAKREEGAAAKEAKREEGAAARAAEHEEAAQETRTSIADMARAAQAKYRRRVRWWCDLAWELQADARLTGLLTEWNALASWAELCRAMDTSDDSGEVRPAPLVTATPHVTRSFEDVVHHVQTYLKLLLNTMINTPGMGESAPRWRELLVMIDGKNFPDPYEAAKVQDADAAKVQDEAQVESIGAEGAGATEAAKAVAVDAQSTEVDDAGASDASDLSDYDE